MKLAASLLPLALAAAPVIAAAQAAEYVYVLSAGEMRSAIDQGNKIMAAGYIAGVMDAMMRTRDFCVPEGISQTDIGARAYRLMGQQDRDSKAPAADVIAVFLHGDYPCRK